MPAFGCSACTAGSTSGAAFASDASRLPVFLTPGAADQPEGTSAPAQQALFDNKVYDGQGHMTLAGLPPATMC